MKKMPKEFISKLEEILPAEELLFEPTPSFGKYKIFLEHAVAHPAKANTELLEFLILKFTKPGDVILDPMAGSGSTGVVAALHGRNAIQVELEKRFFNWMEKARENVEKHPTLTAKGWIRNICGDARRLSELLTQVDIAITSPPYGESYLGGGDSEKRRERLIKAGYNPKDFLGGRARNTVLKHYDEVDTIITSPPYSESLSAKSGGMRGMKNAPKDSTVGIDGNPQLYSQNEQNIGNLPLGNVDAVITSPPYLKSAESGAGVNRQREGDVRIGCSTVGRTVENPDAIDNVRDYGSIEALARGLMTRDGKPTYLSEMLKVYAQMFKVLKPNGLAIIIVKPFIRNKKPVDLPYHTYLLMSMVGFKLEKLYKLRLKNFSFWRILYMKKYPEVPRISHEYVLVCRKNVSHITSS
jgi:DNA modification methylase